MKYIMPIIGLVIVVVFMVVIYNGLTAFNIKAVSNKDVWKQTQVMINDILVSPKTAVYPKLGERGVEVENRKDTTYYVKGYVDSMNGMGVPVRTRFETVIKCEGANKWKMVSWDTEDAKAIRQYTEEVAQSMNNAFKQIDQATSKYTADAERAQREAEAEAARLQATSVEPIAPVEQPVQQPAPTSNWGGSQ